jgi:hypothetical protein
MTQRQPCPPAPGPLEAYASHFDDLLATLAQRRGFRTYLQGLLLPRDRHKTLTGLVGAEPIRQAQAPEVQRLQCFVSESPWDAERINAQRVELLLSDPATAPHDAGALVLDETGDRKDGTKTAHVGRQYLGSVGKTDNGIVAVTSLWADERLYYPLHVRPYTPAKRLAKGKQDPAFRTKPQLAVELVDAALEAGIAFRAVVADCTYGDNPTFEETLHLAGLPYVLGLKPSKGTWAPIEAAHTPKEAAERLRWHSPERPGDWTPIERSFRDGHTETWWAADLTLGGYGPEQAVRLVVATADPATLPAKRTWYLTTNLPRPGSPRAHDCPLAPADLAEIVRLYGLRNWVEQSYKQSKQELGWADFMVRADTAIRRHWTLVLCAFSFCWHAWFHHRADTPAPPGADADPLAASPPPSNSVAPVATERGENPRPTAEPALDSHLARDAPTDPRLAAPVAVTLALLARLVYRAAPAAPAGAPSRGDSRLPAPPLSPALTNYR